MCQTPLFSHQSVLSRRGGRGSNLEETEVKALVGTHVVTHGGQKHEVVETLGHLGVQVGCEQPRRLVGSHSTRSTLSSTPHGKASRRADRAIDGYGHMTQDTGWLVVKATHSRFLRRGASI
jgi:hypothetical protein